MIQGFREISGRALCLLAVFGLLTVAAPGCGDASKTEGGAKVIPSNVQESNKNMENLMKTQPATKKK